MTSLVLSSPWQLRLNQRSRLLVGYSGGLDSTVLLHWLASQSALLPQLIAVHINHGISPNAQAWQAHCEHFCSNAMIDFSFHRVHFDLAKNIEEQARIARYAVFSSLLNTNDALLLGHHRDDQAETVLLQLFRGAGIDGLAGMNEVGQLAAGFIYRPFLNNTREELRDYARQHQLNWIEDESNADIKYSRNYLRQQILPLVIKRWPGAISNLTRTAAHCQEAKANLEDLAINDCHELAGATAALKITNLNHLSDVRLTNVLRVWLKKNQVQMPSTAILQQIISTVILAAPDTMPLITWNNVQVRRYQHILYLDKKEKTVIFPVGMQWNDFPSPLIVPGNIISITAQNAPQGLLIPHNAHILVKFREGGERFVWHGQTKQLKKLLQEWAVAPWLRNRIPLIFVNGQLAAIVGYAISDLFFATSPDAWLLLSEANRYSYY